MHDIHSVLPIIDALAARGLVRRATPDEALTWVAHDLASMVEGTLGERVEPGERAPAETLATWLARVPRYRPPLGRWDHISGPRLFLLDADGEAIGTIRLGPPLGAPRVWVIQDARRYGACGCVTGVAGRGAPTQAMRSIVEEVRRSRAASGACSRASGQVAS